MFAWAAPTFPHSTRRYPHLARGDGESNSYIKKIKLNAIISPMSLTSKDINIVLGEFEEKRKKLFSKEDDKDIREPQKSILSDFIEIIDILVRAKERAELLSLEKVDVLSASPEDVLRSHEEAEVEFSEAEQRRLKQLILSMLLKSGTEEALSEMVTDIRGNLSEILSGGPNREVIIVASNDTERKIDPSKNLWDEFVRVRNLGSSHSEQMDNLFGMMFSDNLRLWEDVFGEDAPSFKWMSWKQPTTDGSEITLGNVIDSIDGKFKTEVKKRIEVFSKVFESAHAWHKSYASPEAAPTIDHLDKYLFSGEEMQAIKESGYSPLGLDFFDLMCESLQMYQYWNADRVYIHETRTPSVPNDEVVLEEILAIPEDELLGGLQFPRFSLVEKYYDFDLSNFKKEEYRQRVLSMFTNQSGRLIVDEPNLIALLKKSYYLASTEQERDRLLRQEVIGFLRSKKVEAVQSEKLTKYGIFPIIEVGEKYQRRLPDGRNATQINFFRETEILPHVVSYARRQIENDPANRNRQREKIRAELLASGNNNPTEEDIARSLEKKIEYAARQSEMFALAFYVGQGITAKDDDVTQFATCKMWRLLATAWYRGKYPGMEGAEPFKGEVLQLVVPWTQYASASVEVIDEHTGRITREARSLETVFANPQMRKSADFTVIGTDMKSAYVGRGVRNANEIYEMLKNGLGFDPRHMADYKSTGDFTDKFELVINSDITQKLQEKIIRSIIGYYVDAFSTKKKSSADGIEAYNRNWQKIGDAYQMFIDVEGIRSGGIDNSMISMSPQQLDEFSAEADRLGFKMAMQKWFTSLLIEIICFSSQQEVESLSMMCWP